MKEILLLVLIITTTSSSGLSRFTTNSKKSKQGQAKPVKLSEQMKALKRKWIGVHVEFWNINQPLVKYTAEIDNVTKDNGKGFYDVTMIGMKKEGILMSERDYKDFNMKFKFPEDANGLTKISEVVFLGEQGRFERKNDRDTFSVRFIEVIDDFAIKPAFYKVEDWLKNCKIDKVYKVTDLRKNRFSEYQMIGIYHQAVVVRTNPNHSSSMEQCKDVSLLFNFLPKSKKQHESVNGQILVEIIELPDSESFTKEIAEPPESKLGMPSEMLWKRDVEFNSYTTNVDGIKKILKAIPFQKYGRLNTKKAMNCWKGSNYMMYAFQILSECKDVFDDCVTNIKNEFKNKSENASRKKEKHKIKNETEKSHVMKIQENSRKFEKNVFALSEFEQTPTISRKTKDTDKINKIMF